MEHIESSTTHLCSLGEDTALEVPLHIPDTHRLIEENEHTCQTMVQIALIDLYFTKPTKISSEGIGGLNLKQRSKKRNLKYRKRVYAASGNRLKHLSLKEYTMFRWRIHLNCILKMNAETEGTAESGASRLEVYMSSYPLQHSGW